MTYSIRSLSFGLNPRPARRTPFRNNSRLNLLRLEDRLNPDGSADIFSKLNEGLAAWEQVAAQVGEEGLKSEVPFVRDSVAAVLKADEKLREFAQARIADVQALPASVREWFVRNGWNINRLDLTPDATGRVMEVSKKIVLPFTALFAAIGPKTGFSYFDNRIRGDLTGRLFGAIPPAILDVTVGLDIRDSQPAFYIGEGSGLIFKNMSAAGTAAGELGIGALTVQVRGNVELKADAAVRLRDPDLNPDGRVRIADFDRPLVEVVRGDVTGSVKFKDVKLTAKPSPRMRTWPTLPPGTTVCTWRRSSASVAASFARSWTRSTPGSLGSSG